MKSNAIASPSAPNQVELVCLKDGQPVTTSLVMATRFGKRHADVLRSIESLLLIAPETKRNFALCYKNSELQNGKPQPFYEITRDGFTLLAMGFTGREALRFKLDYIAAFNQLEKHALAHVAQRETLVTDLKEMLIQRTLRYQQMYRYLNKGLNNHEIARCMDVSTRMVRKIREEMRRLELLPDQEVFVFAHTGRIARHVPHQLNLLGD
ncbi:MAG: hypothetical protein RLY58_2163 [Pseudomonadota bacterium]|jgi:Rha family phage regulatory protein